LPLPSNSIVLPLRAKCTGGLLNLVNAAVREFGLSLPPEVAPSFTCVAITAAG